MSRWFRHYAGMMRDDKLVRAAMASGQSVERVVWVWGAILESAAEINDGGRYDFDRAEAAYFLRADGADMDAIINALSTGGRLAEGRVVHWGDRQYASDTSATRQAAYRQRKRERDGDVQRPMGDGPVASLNNDVTASLRHGDAPETETDTEPDTETKTAQHSEPREKVGGIPIVLWRGERTAIWFDQLETECREAAGLENDPSPALCDTSPIVRRIDKGADFARDVLPVLRRFAAAGKRGKTWEYYGAAIDEGAVKMAAIPQRTAAPASAPTTWLDKDDPLFGAAAANYEREKGRKPIVGGSRNHNGEGFEFPASCVPLSPHRKEQEAA